MCLLSRVCVHLLTCLIPGSTFISRFNFCVRRQIVYTVSYQSLFIISNKHKIDFTQGAPCQLPSEHSPLHLPSLLPPPPPPPMRTVSSFSPSPGWQGCRVLCCGLEPQCSVGCRRVAVGLSDAAHHGCAKFQCVWARRRGTWKEQGHFILCGFKRVKLSLWKKERERETKRPLIAYK